LTKDEKSADENQSSLEDFFTESEEPTMDLEDSPPEISANPSNDDNPTPNNIGNPPVDDVSDDEDEPPLDVLVE
jgi:hypothetical protein